MNTVTLIGRSTKDVELRFIANSGKAVAKVSMAVNREYSKDESDFFNIVAWGKTAEYLANYLVKGKLFAVHGNLRNNNYEDKNGTKHYTIEINADRVEILEWNNDSVNNSDNSKHESTNSGLDDFQVIDTGEDIPF